ncbi:hypothetical protein LOTGIDRAFT_72364, partial [Lottia gigantea]
VFVMPQRIQKQRLDDMKKSAIKKNIRISPQYCDSVTHVVTGFETLDQVIKSLNVELPEALKEKYIVNLSWFVDSIKACKPVPVEDKHRVKNKIKQEVSIDEEKSNTVQNSIPEWACQRSTPLLHKNSKFTEPLEILEKFAELRDQEQDYSRALAFRRASCVLKSLPYQVSDLYCLKNIKDIGGHSSRVIKDILEDGYCQEVQDILNNPWFHKMKLFTSIFGIGPSTAKKWIDKGWSTLDDINIEEVRNDWRVTWGIAFHYELNDFVSRKEADIFCDIVRDEAEKLLPGVIVQLTGGFRRGKERGHDVDLLITHPELGHEIGLLSPLLQALENRGLILCGNHERATFNPEVYQRDFKLSMRGQLDHFEKWLGICKFPKSFKEGKSELLENKTNHVKAAIIPNSLDEEPARKLQKITSTIDQSPLELFKSDRDWTARRVDLIISPYDQYYYALVGWTGNKHFNRDLRLYSQRVLSMKLTSHGLFDMKKSELVPASSEEEVFTNLNLKYQKPEHRNC